MKRLRIIIAMLIAVGVVALVGVALASVALAQQASWVRSLAEEYSSVWNTAYDEAKRQGLTYTARHIVAEKVLDAYIANHSVLDSDGPATTPTSVGKSQPTPSPTFAPSPVPTLSPTPTPSPVPTLSPTPTPSPVPTLSPTPTPSPVPTLSPTPTPVPTSTPVPTPTPTATPTPTPTPAALTVSDVDGYHSEYEVRIFVSSIGVNLTMTRTNTYTADRDYVKLASDGTLKTGIGGTVLRDRYYWSCNPVNGSTGESKHYATDEYSVDLPKTDLDNAPLLNSSLGRLVSRMCSGEASAPTSGSATESWGEFKSF